MTETELHTRLSTRTRTRTRTIQAWPALEPTAFQVQCADRTTDEPPFSCALLDAAQLPGSGETVGGHCVLGTLLGEGAFGRVFAAEDVETGQQVALKVVGLRRYPREYAEHELRALAAIAHPNVVQLNEHGVEASASEPYLWYTMPLYKGADLAAVLKVQGTLPLSRAHAIFSRIAGGVAEMHSLGIRHQDIKPDNIYLANMAGVAEHHPVLLDLGGAARQNASHPLVATFPFAAPEQSDALIGGLLGDQHPPLTEKVDVYALAATLLFSLIGAEFVGHDIGQSENDSDATPAALLEMRAGLAVIHAARVREPLPAGALPDVAGAARERLNDAFRRWLCQDPALRPTATEFLDELSVLLEWDAEVARKRTARKLRSTVLSVAGGLLLAVCAGGLAGYQWHKRTMGAANLATSVALRKANDASSELQRAGTNLDKIIADHSLGAVDKARQITEIVEALQAQTASLLNANAELERDEKTRAAQAQLRAQQEKAAFESALSKAHVERDTALQGQASAEAARWKAEAERDQARSDQESADRARLNAEQDRTKFQQAMAAAENARVIAEAARDRAEQDQRAAEAAQRRAEAERDQAQQSKAAEVAAALAKGAEAGAAAKNAPSPAASQ